MLKLCESLAGIFFADLGNFFSSELCSTGLKIIKYYHKTAVLNLHIMQFVFMLQNKAKTLPFSNSTALKLWLKFLKTVIVWNS